MEILAPDLTETKSGSFKSPNIFFVFFSTFFNSDSILLPLANFIPEHQGTLKMGYFFHKAKEKNIKISENDFRYNGPVPQSKETAILMLADGCEAALRAMNINASDNEALETISNIFYSRQKDGQLKDSNLSNGEIFLIKRAFLNVWKRIRHRRIQYPTTKNNTFS